MALWDWYNEFMEARGGVQPPSGEALFTYRVTGDEYDLLCKAVRAEGQGRLSVSDLQSFEAGLIVLYVSEWWRRQYEGGVWKWATPFEELALEAPSYGVTIRLVEKGLEFWKRKVLCWGGARHFLYTLVCEGGLPLRLAERDGAHIRRYLRAILNDIALAGEAERSEAAFDAAEKNADRLPRGLRQDYVFAVARDLALRAWEIQQVLPDDERDPIGYLDRTEPTWRERFPVDLEDRTAAALIRQTVLDAQEARVRSTGQLGFDVELAQLDDDRFVLQRSLPTGLYSETALRSALGARDDDELPVRLQLYAHREEGAPALVALATRVGGAESVRYRVESPQRRPTQLFGPRTLRLGAIGPEGRTYGPSLVPGGIVSDLPLTFGPPDAVTPGDLVGVGRTLSRRDPLVVVYPADRFRPSEGQEDLLELGQLDEGDYRVVLLNGEARFEAADGSACRIVAGADRDATSRNLQMKGVNSPWQSRRFPTFLGPPTFFAGDRNLIEINEDSLVWKPVGPGRNWQPWSDDCLGAVVVRYVEDEEIQGEARACILPTGFTILPRPADSPERAFVTVGGHGAENVEVVSEGVVTEKVMVGEKGELELALKAASPDVAEMDVEIRFREDAHAQLAMPFPAQGFRFVAEGGRKVGKDANLSVDTALGVRAEAFGFHERDRVLLWAEPSAPDLPIGARRRRHFDLHNAGPHTKKLPLRAVRDELELLLSLSRHLDAKVTMWLEVPGPVRRPEKVYLGRYDAELAPDRERGLVTLPNLWESDSALSASVSARLRVRAQHLANLDDEPEELERTEALLTMAWRFSPEARAAGPWLITAWEGERCVARPLLWTVPEDVAATPMPGADVPLVQAMCVSKPEERAAAIDECLSNMPEDMTAPDWRVLKSCLVTVEDLPVETFDVVASLPKHPDALVGTLLMCSREQVKTIWPRMEGLPFMWECVSTDSWERMVRRYRASCRAIHESTLKDLFPVETFVRDSFAPVRAQLGDLGGVLDTVYELLVETADDAFPRVSEHMRVEWARTEARRVGLVLQLQGAWAECCQRHQTESWPVLADDENKHRPRTLVDDVEVPAELESLWDLLGIKPNLMFRHPAAYAPLAAALVAVYADASDVPSKTIAELRRLKAFDVEYFEDAYPVFLALAYAMGGR